MSLDTYTFFFIVIGGVMTVWSFRNVYGSKKEIKEIEYLVFASFWGTVLVAIYTQILKLGDVSRLTDLLGNPFASALVFTTAGVLVGSFLAALDKRYYLRRRAANFLKWIEKKLFY